MTRRLVLVASLPEVDQRNLVLPGGRDVEPLDDAEDRARILSLGEVRWCGSDGAASATAVRLGVSPPRLAAIAAQHLGSWAGRSLVELAAADQAAIEAFHRDPTFAPPEGESRLQVVERVRSWMEVIATDEVGRTVAVVDALIVRAALSVALDAPATLMRVDLVPLSVTVLTQHQQTWRVRTVGASADG